MTGIIPNCFQTPNDHIDRAMHLLTPQEYVVLAYATRHILGWQDKIDDREGHISLSMFERGFTTAKGTVFAGCGLARAAIVKALEALTAYHLLEKMGKPDEKGQKWHIGDTVDWDGLEQRSAEQSESGKRRTSKANAANEAKKSGEIQQGGTSDVPARVVRRTYQTRYVGRTESKPYQNQVSLGGAQSGAQSTVQKMHPVFSTAGMHYKDKVTVDPIKFTMEVNRLFYAYLEVLEEVGRGAAAMYDHLWEQHRENCKTLALARVLPDQLKGYVRSKYETTNEANVFWLGRDEGVPLENVVKGISGWIARQTRTTPTIGQSLEAQRLVDLQARKVAASAAEQEAARLYREGSRV